MSLTFDLWRWTPTGFRLTSWTAPDTNIFDVCDHLTEGNEFAPAFQVYVASHAVARDCTPSTVVEKARKHGKLIGFLEKIVKTPISDMYHIAPDSNPSDNHPLLLILPSEEDGADAWPEPPSSISSQLKVPLRILYTVNGNPEYVLALTPEAVAVHIVTTSIPPPPSSTEPPPRYATTSLKLCLETICRSSPELIQDRSRDHSVYLLDPLEASAPAQSTSTAPSNGPPTTVDLTPAVSFGLMSWALSTDEADPTPVTGTVKTTGAGREMLELIFCLRQTVSVQRASFSDTVRSYSLPPNGDSAMPPPPLPAHVLERLILDKANRPRPSDGAMWTQDVVDLERGNQGTFNGLQIVRREGLPVYILRSEVYTAFRLWTEIPTASEDRLDAIYRQFAGPSLVKHADALHKTLKLVSKAKCYPRLAAENDMRPSYVNDFVELMGLVMKGERIVPPGDTDRMPAVVELQLRTGGDPGHQGTYDAYLRWADEKMGLHGKHPPDNLRLIVSITRTSVTFMPWLAQENAHNKHSPRFHARSLTTFDLIPFATTGSDDIVHAKRILAWAVSTRCITQPELAKRPSMPSPSNFEMCGIVVDLVAQAIRDAEADTKPIVPSGAGTGVTLVITGRAYPEDPRILYGVYTDARGNKQEVVLKYLYRRYGEQQHRQAHEAHFAPRFIAQVDPFPAVPGHRIVVMERVLAENQVDVFTEAHAKSLAAFENWKQEKAILHGDMRPANVLIMRDGSVQIIDWDWACDAGDPLPLRRYPSALNRDLYHETVEAGGAIELDHDTYMIERMRAMLTNETAAAVVVDEAAVVVVDEAAAAAAAAAEDDTTPAGVKRRGSELQPRFSKRSKVAGILWETVEPLWWAEVGL